MRYNYIIEVRRMKPKIVKQDGWEYKEIFIVKEYKSLGHFINVCRKALIAVFGHDDDMTLKVNGHKDKTIEEKLREFGRAEYYSGVWDGWKMGFDFDFDAGRIYVFEGERKG
jgi:hypothetical protein